MQLHAKYMEATWLSTHGRGFRGNFTSAKECSDYGEDLNTIISSTIYKALNMNRNSKGEPKDNSDSDDELDHFNSKNMDISKEYNSE